MSTVLFFTGAEPDSHAARMVAQLLDRAGDRVIVAPRALDAALNADVSNTTVGHVIDYLPLHEPVTTNSEAVRTNLERSKFQNVLPNGQRRLDGRRRKR